MSRNRQLEPGNFGRRGPRWDHPEESCGAFVTTLPDGKQVWTTAGHAANVWRSLSPKIRDLAQQEEFRAVGISFFIYMVGRDKSTASPRIIFCSSDEPARKQLRNAVRLSSILHEYPSIRLGDSSSPLSRSDSGLRTIPPVFPKRSRVQQLQQYQLTPTPDGQTSTQQPYSSAHIDTDSRPGDITEHLAIRERELHENLEALSLDENNSALSGCNDSMYETWTDSLHSKPSTVFSVSESTTRSSIDLESAEEAASETLTIKEDSCDDPSSPEDFTDPELLSDADSVEDVDCLDKYPHPRQEVPNIAKRLLDEYDSYTKAPDQGGNRKYWIGRASNEATYEQSQAASSASQSRKRPFQAMEGFIEDEPTPIAKVKIQNASPQVDKIMACPYWKKDPQQFSGCFKFMLKEVKNVKQHLYRSHKNPIRCPKCQTVFKTEALRDHHIRHEPCDTQPEAEDSGISGDQILELNKKGRANLTQTQRWYVVWGIVFPDIPPPSSPYRDQGLSEDISQFREFTTRYGRIIILDHMRTSLDWTPEDEMRFSHNTWQQIFDVALEGVYSRWLSRRNESDNGSSLHAQKQSPAQNDDHRTLNRSPNLGGDPRENGDRLDLAPALLHEPTQFPPGAFFYSIADYDSNVPFEMLANPMELYEDFNSSEAATRSTDGALGSQDDPAGLDAFL